MQRLYRGEFQLAARWYHVVNDAVEVLLEVVGVVLDVRLSPVSAYPRYLAYVVVSILYQGQNQVSRIV